MLRSLSLSCSCRSRTEGDPHRPCPHQRPARSLSEDHSVKMQKSELDGDFAVPEEPTTSPIKQVCKIESLDAKDLQVIESPEKIYSVSTRELMQASKHSNSVSSWECTIPIPTQDLKDAISVTFGLHSCVSKAGREDKVTIIHTTATVHEKLLPKLMENSERSWIGYQIVCFNEKNMRLHCKNSHVYTIAGKVSMFEDFLPCKEIESFGCPSVKLAFKVYFITRPKKRFKLTEDKECNFLVVDNL